MNLEVGLIRELACEHRSALGRDLVGPRHRALHALGAWGEHELSAVRAQQGAALLAHGFRHGEHDVVAAGSTGERQADAGIARRGLHDGASRLQRTGGGGSVEDGDGDAVFHRIGWVVELQLGGDGGVVARDTVELH